MRDLSSPENVEEIYRDRGEVDITVPIAQGDVFDDVMIPSLGPDPQTVQVVMHPCSLRKGAKLRERVTIAPVRREARRGGDKKEAWTSKYFNHMLLPNLREDGALHVADFRDVAPAESAALRLTSRVATLSAVGTTLLQQRLTFFHSRAVIEREVLWLAAAPVFAELEMQESWVSLALEAGNPNDLEHAVEEFHAWLDEDDRRRRALLQEVARHAELRRETFSEAKARYKA